MGLWNWYENYILDETTIYIMKKLMIIALIACTSFTGFAQSADLRKKVEVNGNAEIEITPDEIYIGISLKEYMKDAKKKVTIDVLEKQLQTATLKAGIAKEDFMINNISSYTNYWEKKKDANFLASKQYRIKMKDLNKLDEIISSVDSKGIAYTNIESYSHSKIEEYKRDLKVKALKNAREKAVSLVEAVGEKLGGVLLIQDYNNESAVQPQMYKTMRMSAAVSDEVAMPDIDFKKIKLNYTINAVFEIK